MPRDDAEFTERFVAALGAMIRAVHGRDQMRLRGEMALLVNAVIEFERTLGERPDDAALVRAVAMLRGS